MKWFKMGDHVKVTGGTRHVGETGLVVRVGRGESTSTRTRADVAIEIGAIVAESPGGVSRGARIVARTRMRRQGGAASAGHAC